MLCLWFRLIFVWIFHGLAKLCLTTNHFYLYFPTNLKFNQRTAKYTPSFQYCFYFRRPRTSWLRNCPTWRRSTGRWWSCSETHRSALTSHFWCSFVVIVLFYCLVSLFILLFFSFFLGSERSFSMNSFVDKSSVSVCLCHTFFSKFRRHFKNSTQQIFRGKYSYKKVSIIYIFFINHKSSFFSFVFQFIETFISGTFQSTPIK